MPADSDFWDNAKKRSLEPICLQFLCIFRNLTLGTEDVDSKYSVSTK